MHVWNAGSRTPVSLIPPKVEISVQDFRAALASHDWSFPSGDARRRAAGEKQWKAIRRMALELAPSQGELWIANIIAEYHPCRLVPDEDDFAEWALLKSRGEL